MDIIRSRPKPCAPIFEVEVIDAEGYACLYGYLYLHEAIKISAYFEGEAWRGKEPRVYIPPALVSVGLTVTDIRSRRPHVPAAMPCRPRNRPNAIERAHAADPNLLSRRTIALPAPDKKQGR